MLPDPIERGEARAEADLDALTAGVPAGKYRCPNCNEIRDLLTDAHPASADPYGPPVCGACIEVLFPEIKALPVKVDPEDWHRERESEDPGAMHPCNDPDPDECDCRGACSCHWVQRPD